MASSCAGHPAEWPHEWSPVEDGRFDDELSLLQSSLFHVLSSSHLGADTTHTIFSNERPPHRKVAAWLVEAGLVLGFHSLLCFLLYATVRYLVIQTFKQLIVQEVGKSYLGVKTHLGGLAVSVLSGRVLIERLVVSNPPGFAGDYLVHVGRVQAHMNMWRFMKSYCCDIEISELILDDIHVVVEFQGSFHKTNVSQILAHLRHTQHKEPSQLWKAATSACHPDTCCLPGTALHRMATGTAGKPDIKDSPPGSIGGPEPSRSTSSSQQEGPQPAKQRVVLHRLQIHDVGLRVASKLFSPAISIGAYEVEDFAAERGAAIAEDLLGQVLHGLLARCSEHMALEAWAGHVRQHLHGGGAARAGEAVPASGAREAGRCRQQ